MLALGGLLMGAAVFALMILRPIFNRPTPPRWTQYRMVGEFVTLAITAALAMGMGAFVAGVVAEVQGGINLLDLALLAAVIAAFVVLGRRMASRRAARAVPRPGTDGLAGAA